ncbi:MAG: alpha-amylase/4-alpha-glucanotransferase domain-containing protein [Thermoprotei archaeon]
MNKINFIFLIHFHQPIGQLKWVLDRIYENSYKLLLNIFREFSDLKLTVHVSGPLLLYMSEYYPEWISGIAKLHDYGTLELVGGTLGEAVLPLLPSSDRIEQIKWYNRIFEKHFGVKPRGMWLPERVWEPGLPEVLAKSGVEYVFIDDSTLYRAGRGEPDTYYAWNTEESGYIVKVFFIDTGLRYVLPWRSSEEVISYMTSKGDDKGNRVIVWGSDAEKFGEWADKTWAEHWLRSFFTKIRENNAVKLVHPSEYLLEHGVKGLLYLPTGSYDKMLEWSGGFFRNFLVKYRESNNMHKKMLLVREKLLKMPYYDEEAWKHYYLAQCNDPYWHGLFGGVYLPHLRQAVYENYIVAERIAEKAIGYYEGVSEPLIRFVDFDYDGELEVIVETPNQNLYFKPSDGGTLFEHDYKVRSYEHNLQDTMTRYYEPYLEGTGFNPDWYRRVSLRTHLWRKGISINDWINNTPFIDQSDLALLRHRVIVTRDKTIILTGIGGFYGYGYRIPVLVEKSIRIKTNGFITEYRLVNLGDTSFESLAGFEYHIAPKIDRFAEETPVKYIVDNNKRDIYEEWVGEAHGLLITSRNYLDIRLEADRKTDLWVSPLYSYARTEKGLQRILQGLAIMFVEELVLKPREEYVIKIDMGVGY